MKLYELKNVEGALNKLFSMELPISVAYKLQKTFNSFCNETKMLEEFRTNLVLKYGKQNSSGEVTVDPSKMKEFTNEYNQLLNTEIEFPIMGISMNELTGSIIKISPIELNNLMRLGFIV